MHLRSSTHMACFPHKDEQKHSSELGTRLDCVWLVCRLVLNWNAIFLCILPLRRFLIFFLLFSQDSACTRRRKSVTSRRKDNDRNPLQFENKARTTWFHLVESYVTWSQCKPIWGLKLMRTNASFRHSHQLRHKRAATSQTQLYITAKDAKQVSLELG